MRRLREFFANKELNLDLTNRERNRFANSALGNLLTSFDAFDFAKKVGNYFTLGDGNMALQKVEKPFSTFKSVSDAEFQRRVEVDAIGAVFIGCKFVDVGDTTTKKTLVNISETSRVVFIGCEFIRLHDAETSGTASDLTGHVVMANGGKATFNGCVFRSQLETGVMNASGFSINNQGAAANAIALGCYNPSTHTFNNVQTDADARNIT